jgi:UDP-N-acetylmuramoyl-L-alanine---L-glutamate ligase
LLIGGLDRGIDYNEFAVEVLSERNIQAILCMPSSGEKLFKLLNQRASMNSVENSPKLLNCSSLEDAFQTAVKVAPTDSTVLLSPAAPSYDKFKNFEERGSIFKSLVQGLGK